MMRLACRTVVLFACLAGSITGFAQQLSLDSAMSWVLREHPLARAADAVESRGPAALMSARGAYDPVLRGSYDRKDYLGTEYFQYGQGGIDWQSPYAFKIEAGREWADGQFFNPERTVPDAGQAYLSIKLPLLQGLLVDKYRTEVSRAQVDIVRNQAAAEVIRNELRYDVAVAYAQWAFAKTAAEVYESTEQLLRDYLSNTRQLQALGDKAAVDTLEASLYLVDQLLVTQQALVDLRIAAQELSALYFPLETTDVPGGISMLTEAPIIGTTVVNNPELAQIRFDFASLELERRLKNEYRKPELNVGYSILGDGFELAPEDSKVDDRSFLTRAYKIGAEFRYPLFTREARGEVALADIKLAETGAKLETKRQQLTAKAEAFRDAVFAYETQLSDVAALIDQAERLLAAERELFDLGEGTQFLLNARAQTLQKARITANKLRFARAKAILSWRQAVGIW